MRTTKAQRDAYKRVMSPEREGTFTFDLIADVEALKARLQAIAEVPCVKRWGTQPMRCLPKDPCSFCRARDAIAEVR